MHGQRSTLTSCSQQLIQSSLFLHYVLVGELSLRKLAHSLPPAVGRMHLLLQAKQWVASSGVCALARCLSFQKPRSCFLGSAVLLAFGQEICLMFCLLCLTEVESSLSSCAYRHGHSRQHMFGLASPQQAPCAVNPSISTRDSNNHID